MLTAGISWGLISYGQTIQVKRGTRQAVNIDSLPESSYYPGQLFIKFKPGFDSKLVAKISKTSAGDFRFGIDSIDAISKLLKISGLKRSFESILQNAAEDAKHKAWGLHRWYSIELPKNINVKEAIKKFRALSSIVEIAEPSYIRTLHDGNDPIQTFTPSDSAYPRQWHYNNTAQEGPTVPAGTDADIDLPEAWDLETGKPSVIVAVLDGGVDTTHPDLKQNLWVGSGGEHFGYNWNTNTPLLQAQAHGSHVCGTIAAVNNNGIGVSGVAGGNGAIGSGARIMSMQIFNPGGSYAGDAGTANAFIYSADRGACIAQNSWGGGSYSTLILDAIDYFIMNGGGTVLNGGLVVFSAGNDNSETKNFPCDYPPVVCVTGTDYDDKKAYYSTYGSWVDIAAPGGDSRTNTRKGVLSTVPISTGAYYGWMAGTSMACPHVSGVAALCVSKSPGKLTNEQLRSIILTNVDDVYTLNPTYAGKLGSGRLNAFLSVQAAALAGGTMVDSAKNFKASQSCGQSTLSWTKNAAGNDVIIAESDTLVFGTPSGVLNAGAYIPGGGKIIYKGGATNFLVSIPPNKREYFRIWSFSGTNYSFHRTTSTLYSSTTSAPVVTDGGVCDVNISWTDVLGCPSDSIMLIADNKIPFGIPSGIMKVSDTVAGGAKVIYKGKGSNYVFTSDVDSTVYIQKWNFNESHQYSNPYAATNDSVNKLNSIASIIANAVSNTEIDISWLSAASDCFGGSTYMLAYSSNSTFGNPSGTYIAGNNIAGGGKVLYIGNNTNFQHMNLLENTDYCYKVWKVRNNNQYSAGKSACSKTLCSNINFQLPFSDGFNGVNLSDPNVCIWTITNNTTYSDVIKIVTNSVNPSVIPVEGSAMLRFNSYNISSNQKARLTSRVIQKGAGTSLDVLFRWYQDSSNYTTSEYATEGVTVQWSADNSNWKNLEFYPRVPVQGLTGWSYKQITLPDTAAAKDNIYISFLFNSRFGQNCYLDDLKFKISSYKPSNGITHAAASESTDSLSKWTNYYDSTGDRLLSIKKNGHNIGKAGEAGFALKVGGNSTTSKIPISGTNYVTNTGGWICMNRYYTVKPITEPTDTVGVRFYYSGNDFNALNTAGATLTPSRSSIAHTDMYAYKINDINTAYNSDPASLHTNIPATSNYNTNGFAQYYSGHAADTISWKYRNLGNGIHSMEYTVGHLGGGGLGIGSINGMGAKLPTTTYTFTGYGNWNNSTNWLNNIKPPLSLPANALIIVDGNPSGECILNVSQTILPGGSLIVKPGKKLTIAGGLQKVY